MEWLRVAYVGAFGGAALLSLSLVPRTRVVSETDTRRALAALLVISGAWAGVAALQVLADTLIVKTGLYVIGLAIGLSAVLAWLAFCSAYTGHKLHRNRAVQTAAIAIYLLIVVIKFTNPIHGQYFAATLATSPFHHLELDRFALDWVVTGGAYLASGYGFFQLYDTLSETEYGTGSLWAVLSLAALPIVPGVLAGVDIGGLLDMNYEPIGVALFALGALYFTEEKFSAVGRYGYASVFNDLGEAVVVVDTDGMIRRVNQAATDAFPALEGAVGERAAEVAPAFTDEADRRILTAAEDGSHFVRKSTPLTVGNTDVGIAVVLTDVTDIEQKRRELERQNEQLDDFAAAIDHELRNTLGIAVGHTNLARARLNDEPTVDEALAVVDETLERMHGITEDLSTLARRGQTVSRTSPCDIEAVVRRARTDVGVTDVALDVHVDADGPVRANKPRLTDLFAAVFEFAATDGASWVSLEVDGETVTVTMDCDPIPAEQVDEALAYSAAVPSAEAGMLLANVRTLATAHGWFVDLDPEADNLRLVISGVKRIVDPDESQ